MTQPDWPCLRGHTILQVIPDLAAGGAERTTIEMAEAVHQAGGRALVVSEGGRLEGRLTAAGGELIRLPVAGEFDDPDPKCGPTGQTHTVGRSFVGPCAVSRARLECAVGLQTEPRSICHNLSWRL